MRQRSVGLSAGRWAGWLCLGAGSVERFLELSVCGETDVRCRGFDESADALKTHFEAVAHRTGFRAV